MAIAAGFHRIAGGIGPASDGRIQFGGIFDRACPIFVAILETIHFAIDPVDQGSEDGDPQGPEQVHGPMGIMTLSRRSMDDE